MKKILKNTLLALGMSLAVAALISRWPEIQPRLAGTNWLLLSLAALGLLAYQLVNAGLWSLVLASIGQRVSFCSAARVWLQSEALRWLPGGIWGYGSRVVNAKELGVNKSKASASLIVELGMTNLAWGAAATLLLFTPLAHLAHGAVNRLLPNNLSWELVIAGAAVVAALASSFLFYFAPSRKMFASLLARLPWRELRLQTSLRSTLAYLGLCVFNGLLLWLVILAVPNLSVSPLVAIGMAGGAWLVGFWAIGVPGGIGVREAALAGMLAVYGDLDSGIAVAVLWRGLQMTIEILSLALVSLPAFRTGITNFTHQRCRTEVSRGTSRYLSF